MQALVTTPQLSAENMQLEKGFEDDISKEIIDCSVYKIASPVILSSMDDLCGDTVFLTKEAAEGFSLLTETSSQKYVRIGARVFRISIHPQLQNEQVGIHLLQNEDAKTQNLIFPNGKIKWLTLHPFALKESQIKRVAKVNVLVLLNRDYDQPGKNARKISREEFKRSLASKLNGTFVGCFQNFMLNLPDGSFQVSVKKMQIIKKNSDQPAAFNFGYIDSKTVFKCKSANPADLKFVDRLCDDEHLKFQFTAHPKNKREYKYGVMSPLCINVEYLQNELVNKLRRKRLTIGDNVHLKGAFGRVQFSLTQIADEKKVQEEHHNECFICQNPKQIEFIHTNELIIAYGRPFRADQIHIEIYSFIKSNDTSSDGLPNMGCVDASEVANLLLRTPSFSKKQTFALKIPQGTIFGKIKRICPDINLKEGKKIPSRKHSVWYADDNTEIKVETASALQQLIVIDRHNPHPLKSVKIDISADSVASLCIDQLLLQKALEGYLNKVLYPGQIIHLNLKEYPKLHLKLLDFNYEDIQATQVKYALPGEIQKETVFHFSTEMKSVKIKIPGQELKEDDPIEILEALGIGGLPKELDEMFADLYFYRMNREILKERGVRMPNGILIYGPPGSGKTFLAKGICNAIREKFKFVTATELYNRYLGGTEKNIRELFDSKEYTIIILDEIDAISGHRHEEQHKVHKNSVTQLLGCMNEAEEKNKFIIATTNMLDAIDEALLRSGRIEEKYFLGLPNEEGRKKMFEVQSKVQHKGSPLDRDVDFAHLAEKTDGFTAADIERVVNLACSIAAKRSIKNSNKSETVKMDDYKQALLMFERQNPERRTRKEDAELIGKYIS